MQGHVIWHQTSSELPKKISKKMEDMGIVRKSSSPLSSPLHMVPKAQAGWRPCGDYCCLNDATTPDRYPVPHIQDFSAYLSSCKIFSKIDLVWGYNQIPVSKEDIPKPAIITPFGLYEFFCMPFSLKNAAQAFQRLMDMACRGLNFLFVYIDDILVASTTEREHTLHLRQLLIDFLNMALLSMPQSVCSVKDTWISLETGFRQMVLYHYLSKWMLLATFLNQQQSRVCMNLWG